MSAANKGELFGFPWQWSATFLLASVANVVIYGPSVVTNIGQAAFWLMLVGIGLIPCTLMAWVVWETLIPAQWKKRMGALSVPLFIAACVSLSFWLTTSTILHPGSEFDDDPAVCYDKQGPYAC